MSYFCNPLKTSKNHKLPDVFRGYRNGTLAQIGLILTNLSPYTYFFNCWPWARFICCVPSVKYVRTRTLNTVLGHFSCSSWFFNAKLHHQKIKFPSNIFLPFNKPTGILAKWCWQNTWKIAIEKTQLLKS